MQTCEETLARRSGSCRDSAWLLVQVLRNLGLAARFVSGYLIQLRPDVKPLDGPAGAEHDFSDLHAWAEVFLPGAGWVGLDPTSGLLTGEGHLPLAASPDFASAAPLTGTVDPCETKFDFQMRVTRIHEDPRVTRPYSEEQWQRIEQVGQQVDKELAGGDVRLTMGGEPTFVSLDDIDGAEWNTAALGENKRRMAGELFRRMARRFASGALLHFGQGKWYPGESLPRWALGCYWRADGEPIWNNPELIAQDDRAYRVQRAGSPGVHYASCRASRRRSEARYRRIRRRLALPVEGTASACQRRPAEIEPRRRRRTSAAGTSVRAGPGTRGRLCFAAAAPFQRGTNPLGERFLDVPNGVNVFDSGRLADGLTAAARLGFSGPPKKTRRTFTSGIPLRTGRRCLLTAAHTAIKDRRVCPRNSDRTALESLRASVRPCDRRPTGIARPCVNWRAWHAIRLCSRTPPPSTRGCTRSEPSTNGGTRTSG